ncbi:hypothetical protein NEA10_16205 [Phormidium yuhuli AB48]|uniref:Uncharacterized protein n=1 Tax=Phormidium yuhuli AB48 TaxID=2940671 RepID=A0ABY5ANE6_9CYAN|nr:hypothetical protein [Phormidium yuhuli]USR90367.1 hypothetical protein NEA10_16205 [Phormidium yuhuli AB48]
MPQRYRYTAGAIAHPYSAIDLASSGGLVPENNPLRPLKLNFEQKFVKFDTPTGV